MLTCAPKLQINELEPDVIDDSGSLVDLECTAGSIL